MTFLASSNLITDLKFKQKVGVKADAHVEALAVINQENSIEEQNLQIDLEARDELQINAKLFLKSFKPDLALEALQTLKEALGNRNGFFSRQNDGSLIVDNVNVLQVCKKLIP